MRETPSLKYFCVVLVAICSLILPEVPLAHAGKGKPGFVRVSKQHARSGHGSGFRQKRHARHGNFKQKRFGKHSRRPDFVKRRGHKRRYSYGSTYNYGYGRRYGYGRDYGYRDYPRYEPIYRSETRPAVQPYQARPVTPKWVHVDSTGGTLTSYTAEAPNAESGVRRNCLSVKTEITVDGKLVDAFGEACILADGTWELRPSEQND